MKIKELKEIKKPTLGWKDSKIYLFNKRYATPEQIEALTPFIGKSITDEGGGELVLKALEVAKQHGIGK